MAREDIWDFGRTTCWRAINAVMAAAGIEGVQANPKGLRHSFVIEHQELGTPEHMIQRWAGRASRDMMEVRGRAVGQEKIRSPSGSGSSNYINNIIYKDVPMNHRRLKPLQLLSTDEDYRKTLPIQFNRAEAKIVYALLQRRISEEEADHAQID